MQPQQPIPFIFSTPPNQPIPTPTAPVVPFNLEIIEDDEAQRVLNEFAIRAARINALSKRIPFRLLINPICNSKRYWQ